MSEFDPESKQEVVGEQSFDQRDSNAIIESTIGNTEADQRERQRKPLTNNKKNPRFNKKEKQEPPVKGKRKKWLFFIIVITAIASYFYIRNYFKPQQEIIEEEFLKEGMIQFDAHLSQKFSIIKQVLDHHQLVGQSQYFSQRLILDIDPQTMTQTTPIFLSLAPFRAASEPQPSFNLKEICAAAKGVQIQLQPRFFGASLPFGFKDSFTVKNLKYLTIDQIIEDMAYAIDRIVKMNFFGIGQKNPWFISGEGHTAMLALWFRAKYPKLTVGAYASSPIIPTLLTPNVSVKLYTNVISGGKTCRSVLVALLKDLLQQVNGEMKEGFLLEMGLGVALKSEEALQMFMQRARLLKRQGLIQICSMYDEQTLFKELQKLLYKAITQYTDPLAFSVKQMSSPQEWEYFPQVRTRRAFEWLKCKQLGMFPIAPTSTKYYINFEQLNEGYFKNKCKALFSTQFQPVPWPRSDMLVSSYEKQLSKATRMFIVHGYYDIWIPYAYTPENSVERQITTKIVKCSNCVQNFDAKFASSFNKKIDQIRTLEKETFMKWLVKQQ